MIMISPANYESEFSKYIRTPDEVGGYNTQTPYFIIEEIDIHNKKAKAANAEIISEK